MKKSHPRIITGRKLYIVRSSRIVLSNKGSYILSKGSLTFLNGRLVSVSFIYFQPRSFVLHDRILQLSRSYILFFMIVYFITQYKEQFSYGAIGLHSMLDQEQGITDRQNWTEIFKTVLVQVLDFSNISDRNRPGMVRGSLTRG